MSAVRKFQFKSDLDDPNGVLRSRLIFSEQTSASAPHLTLSHYHNISQSSQSSQSSGLEGCLIAAVSQIGRSLEFRRTQKKLKKIQNPSETSESRGNCGKWRVITIITVITCHNNMCLFPFRRQVNPSQNWENLEGSPCMVKTSTQLCKPTAGSRVPRTKNMGSL